ncbi:MAG: nucleotidyltransferase family protein [Pseudomonadota bacterium]
MKAVILAGGQGTRLRKVVADRPKPLAEINSEPFLALQLRQLSSFGLNQVVFCVSDRAEMIMSHFGNGKNLKMSIEYAVENEPLDTAGAIKNANALLGDEEMFLVLNGDTFLEVDLNALIEHKCQKTNLGTLCVHQTQDAAGKGVIEIAHNGRILTFNEKTSQGEPAIVNAGVYVFSKEILDHIPANTRVSLERETLPNLLRQGKELDVFETNGTFIDIGTPSEYFRAQQELKKYGS